MFSQIINPKTGRRVSINSRLGRKILSNYVNQLGGHNGPCAINSKSGRCRKSSTVDGKCKLINGNCRKINERSVTKSTTKKPRELIKKRTLRQGEFAGKGSSDEIHKQWKQMVTDTEFNYRYASELMNLLDYYPSEEKLEEMMDSKFAENIKEHFGIDQLHGVPEFYKQYLESIQIE